jgi:RNA polymerase II subunit A small phosphatase-like protein
MQLLVIFDIDETLVYTRDEALACEPTFRLGTYNVYVRPYAHQLMAVASEVFDDVAFWTAGSREYGKAIAGRLLPSSIEPFFVWGRERATRRLRDLASPGALQVEERWYYRKYIYKVPMYDRSNVIAVDDRPESFEHDYGNLLSVRPFTGDQADDELRLLATYLQAIPEEVTAHVHTDIDLRAWRRQI